MYIMGIGGGFAHDTSACLVKDGVIVAAAEEERFVRIRYAEHKLPWNSARFCLEQEGLLLEDLDYVALSWDPDLFIGKSLRLKDEKFTDSLFPKSMFPRSVDPCIIPIEHHLAHAASAYYLSPFDEATILVIDGQGERVSTSIAHGKSNGITMLHQFPIPDSLGYFYEACTHFLGLGFNNAGKTMGLVAYGTPRFELEEIKCDGDGYHITDMPKEVTENAFMEVIKAWYKVFYRKGWRPNKELKKFDQFNQKFTTVTEEFESTHIDIAASVQKKLEEVVTHIVQPAIHETGCRKVCLAGGVALNCVMNGKLLHSNIIDDIFVQPAANDAGASLGAALELGVQLGQNVKHPMQHLFMGPDFSNEDVREFLTRLKIRFEEPDDISLSVSELLAENKIVGWFQEKMEFGPRALGHRTILANPADKETKQKVSLVKGREIWRPFAPSILHEHSSKCLGTDRPYPYMIISQDLLPSWQERVASVSHVDGSCRPQTVDKSDIKYYNLLKHFYDMTGIPLVLNTSLNLRGSPIACAPIDAVNTFILSSMDAIAIGNFLITKE